MRTSTPDNCPHCGKQIGADLKRRLFAPEEDARLLQMHQAGSHPKDIAKELGRPVTSIRSRLTTMEKTNAKPARAQAPRDKSSADGEEEEATPSSITVLPGVRIITHRMRG